MTLNENKLDLAYAQECAQRWGNYDEQDERIDYFLTYFEEWVNQIPEDIQPMVADLLSLFEYYSEGRIQQILYALKSRLDADEHFDSSTTIYAVIPSGKGIWNSNLDYLYSYARMHKINKYYRVTNLKEFAKKCTNYNQIKNVVVVDDCCCSGGTMKKFLKQYTNQLQGKKIFYLVAYAMDGVQEVIDKIAEDYNIEVFLIPIRQEKKAFDHEIFAGHGDACRSALIQASEKLHIEERWALGFLNSEAAVAFYNDTPNNTLGFFWRDTDSYFSIFPREVKDHTNLKSPTPKTMRAEKRSRAIQNYNTVKRRQQQ